MNRVSFSILYSTNLEILIENSCSSLKNLKNFNFESSLFYSPVILDRKISRERLKNSHRTVPMILPRKKLHKLSKSPSDPENRSTRSRCGTLPRRRCELAD